MSATTGAKEENFSGSPTNFTSGVTERARSRARESKVQPSKSKKALSEPMRELLPPARMKAVREGTGRSYRAQRDAPRDPIRIVLLRISRSGRALAPLVKARGLRGYARYGF